MCLSRVKGTAQRFVRSAHEWTCWRCLSSSRLSFKMTSMDVSLANVTNSQSLSLIKNMLRISVSSICYHRDLFPKVSTIPAWTLL